MILFTFPNLNGTYYILPEVLPNENKKLSEEMAYDLAIMLEEEEENQLKRKENV